MPVPKKKQKLYGKVIGHMINTGKSQAEAKNIADKAVKVDVDTKKKKTTKKGKK